MYCRKCGNLLNENANFCNKCGFKVKKEEPKKKEIKKEIIYKEEKEIEPLVSDLTSIGLVVLFLCISITIIILLTIFTKDMVVI